MKFSYAFGFMLAVALFGGCAGPHLYDPSKADLARQGKETVDSLDFSEFLAAEDKNIAVYQQQETEAQHENVRLTRDLRIANLAASKSSLEQAWLGQGDGALGRHLSEVFGRQQISISELKKGAKANDLQLELDSAYDGVRERQEILAGVGLSPPSCDPSRGGAGGSENGRDHGQAHERSAGERSRRQRTRLTRVR